jgi:hypothetical protein
MIDVNKMNTLIFNSNFAMTSSNLCFSSPDYQALEPESQTRNDIE